MAGTGSLGSRADSKEPTADGAAVLPYGIMLAAALDTGIADTPRRCTVDENIVSADGASLYGAFCKHHMALQI